ncbi:hypothetical protein HETIRDRAFT_439781 [Heterobasidion irregulare TC 32-1]|uniref:Uncharacterized protein n=1 Tax=Heterobasidion irregulare (strain TC 32-1) TaxID=747525 RepID=W4KC38_HETIT|nr:uncharacterized protein HETIRDRAFT_439781 [Heterobasidion irregulare TC 32-1]ETW83437.1 hypothetical protein HETIRDRAFT_439781 [Heterobasidion irregulare TC 32-1]
MGLTIENGQNIFHLPSLTRPLIPFSLPIMHHHSVSFCFLVSSTPAHSLLGRPHSSHSTSIFRPSSSYRHDLFKAVFAFTCTHSLSFFPSPIYHHTFLAGHLTTFATLQPQLHTVTASGFRNRN